MENPNYIVTPSILRETSRGYETISILNDMFSHRQINCVTEINAESVNSMIMQLLHLEQENPNGEITIFINSPGGSVSDGLALYDVMKAISCPIRTVCMGTAASMGAILFVAGDKRQMLEHSKVMIHDPLVRTAGGSALSLKAISDNLMVVRDTTAHILAEHSGRSVEDILEKTSKDTYMSAKECLEFGFCDEIISKL